MYHADPAHAGRGIRCRCGNIITIDAVLHAATPPAARKSGARRPRRSGPRWWTRLPRLNYRPFPLSARAHRVLRWLCWGYPAATAAYAGLLWLTGDTWWPATILLFGPRWPVLLPLPLLAIAALLFRPRLLGPVALGAWLALGPAMGFRLGWRGWASGAPDRPALRLVTFNADAGDNSRILAVSLGLAGYAPDVVLVQECVPALAAAEHWPEGWRATHQDGLCLASRFPVLASATLGRVSTGDQGGTGLVMLYRLKGDDGVIDLVSLHLETPRKGLELLGTESGVESLERNQLVRDVGSRRMARWIREQSDAAIVAGDFNMPVESRIYRRYWTGCGNAFSRVGRGFGWTRFFPKFAIRIDHVLTCGGWRATRAQVGPDLGSDHRPLIVDLERVR
jgi:endonuclease/exonuclease/phosphatase (EEP) superfamily protein YafD